MTSGTRTIRDAPRVELSIDATVLMFTAGVMALAAVLFGLVPALTAFASAPAHALRESGGTGQTKSLRHIVDDVLTGVSVVRTTTLSEQLDASIVPERLIATLSGFFGGAGILLAAIGLFGLSRTLRAA